ncbi:16866_t:CDS:2 [Cetraspora pellucida]|uniref:16866_t:CDS:1 n=1 Tax=Cetraspora pellucida TaxID=1433469 RepID=A0A9N9D5G7_9GLOM|nr:16866_t:CDS:2 [Cetraspora pellucida]
MDETGFILIPKLEKVIAKKGSHQVHKVAHGNSHEHISVAPTILATGSYILPLVIYKYDKYHNTTSKVVTKYTFAKLFGPAFIETYALSAICNAFKATGIWLFNSKTISPDHLNPSLATEQFDIVPSPSQLSKLIMSSLQSTTKLNHFHYTCINFIQLISENEMLKNEIKLLKVQLTATQEELETYKSLGTSSLYSVFKYISHVPQAGPSDISSVNQQEPSPFFKKRKTFLFAQLLTNDESWQKLKETNKEAERKVEEVKWKKVLAAQKKIKRQQKLEQKKEEHE